MDTGRHQLAKGLASSFATSSVLSIKAHVSCGTQGICCAWWVLLHVTDPVLGTPSFGTPLFLL